MGPESRTQGEVTRFVAVFWAILLITASVPIVAGVHDGSPEQDPRAAAIGPGQGAPGPTALAAPTDRNPTTLAAAAQSGADAPPCGKAPGSVSGEAIPVWVDFVCTASSKESSTFRIEMRQAWVYVVKIQAPSDASASQILNGTSQTLVRHGLPESKLGVWPPVLQQYGKRPGEVTIIGNFGSSPDLSLGSRSEVGVWEAFQSQPSVELNPGVYQVRVIAIEPFVTPVENLKDLTPEEITQLAVSGGDRRTATLVLESGGCVAGYDPWAHHRTLSEQQRTLWQQFKSQSREFQELKYEFGWDVGKLTWGLLIGEAFGATATAFGVPLKITSSTTLAKAASYIDTANDLLSVAGLGKQLSQGRALVDKMRKTHRQIEQKMEQKKQVRRDIERCAGGKYVASESGGR